MWSYRASPRGAPIQVAGLLTCKLRAPVSLPRNEILRLPISNPRPGNWHNITLTHSTDEGRHSTHQFQGDKQSHISWQKKKKHRRICGHFNPPQHWKTGQVLTCLSGSCFSYVPTSPSPDPSQVSPCTCEVGVSLLMVWGIRESKLLCHADSQLRNLFALNGVCGGSMD